VNVFEGLFSGLVITSLRRSNEQYNVSLISMKTSQQCIHEYNIGMPVVEFNIHLST
jgi:hypothetical protein